MIKPWKMSRAEKNALLAQGPRMEEVYNSIEIHHRIAKGVHKDIEKAIAIARKFNNEVLRPMYLDRDLKHMEDHDFLSTDIIKKAGEWRFFTLFVPKLFGGQNIHFMGLYPFIEEIASVCSGLGHLIFVHYLGAATVFPSMNMRVLQTIFRDVAKSEKKGEPHLVDLTITEPDAGSDAQEPILINRGRMTSTMEKVKGGYRVNARKVFISNSRLSYWHLIHSWEDKNDRASSLTQFVIPNGTKGLSFGASEKKMGTLASTADEVICEDVFVPDKWVSVRAREPFYKNSKKGPKWVVHTLMDFVVSASRAGVGAIATGIGRCAYEIAMDYARRKRVGGELLVNHQWAQIILTDMFRNVCMTRNVYMESVYADMLCGIFKILYKKPIHYYMKYMPKWFFTLMLPVLKSRIATYIFRKYYCDWYTDEERNISSGWASFAKYTCSDYGLVNANLALDLMGADGLRHDHGAEKCFRDVKLQQIYESTNQVNQMNAFYCMVGNNYPDVEYFK